jgi:hypothetical protein
MWIMADVSGSTNTAYDTGTTWGYENAGIQGFVNARSGIGVGMIFAPDATNAVSCCTDTDCGALGTCSGAVPYTAGICLIYGTCGGTNGCTPSSYAPPAVPLTILPDTSNVIATAIANHGPGGGSMGTGALDGLRQNAINAYRSGGKTVLVMLADGDPNGCTSDSWASVGAMAQTAATGIPPLPTYIVSLGVAPSAAVQSAAQMGGTTALTVPAGLTLAQATAEMTNVLDTIASDACK